MSPARISDSFVGRRDELVVYSSVGAVMMYAPPFAGRWTGAARRRIAKIYLDTAIEFRDDAKRRCERLFRGFAQTAQRGPFR